MPSYVDTDLEKRKHVEKAHALAICIAADRSDQIALDETVFAMQRANRSQNSILLMLLEFMIERVKESISAGS